jgi:sirohydrochlorin cobaltochelatase
MSQAIVLLGHGSRDPEGAREYLAVAEAVRAALPGVAVEAGVLEFAGPVAPSIEEAFARAVGRGARQILAVPVLLHWGVHGTTDMPVQVAEAQARYSHVELRLARTLEGHPALLDLVAERCAAIDPLFPQSAPPSVAAPVAPSNGQTSHAHGHSDHAHHHRHAAPHDHHAPHAHSHYHAHPHPPAHVEAPAHPHHHAPASPRAAPAADPATTVLLVGRGSTQPRANADLYATARLFQERGLYAQVEVCFVSLAPPCVFAGVRRCVVLGARRLLVVPYFINTGLLVRRISAQVAAARLFYPDTAMFVAAHFGPDPKLIGALVDRAREAWPELVAAAADARAAARGAP